MPERIVKLRDAFGVGRDVPLNYVTRAGVDESFVNSLTRDKHVVIYGSSKQGKTTLRRHCLDEGDYIIVSCLNTMNLVDLQGAILKAAGYRIEQTQTKTIGGAWKYGAEFAGEGQVPFITKVSGKGNVGREANEKLDIVAKHLEIDLGDVNDIILSLKEINFNKYIVLEDFHYLSNEVQRAFSFALKAFHENSPFCFIVIGVWREKNRLIYYNGDLTNRVISIDADAWTKDQLREVITAGEQLLNIRFENCVVEELLQHCFESVALVQEGCYRICEKQGVVETKENLISVGYGIKVEALVREIVNDQAGRYMAFITNFSEGFQQTDLEMYKWLVYAVLISPISDLENGLRRSQVSSIIKGRHPEGGKLNEGNITQALQNTASLQIQKGIRPIIFDYDQTTRVLTVVDRSFLLWLAHQDQGELIAELGIA
ncbi:MAG: hypothetical protein F8N37_22840 [Telmatospirillum sp.]|nr:hypothetical protein [Telmatospirillum sp.]